MGVAGMDSNNFVTFFYNKRLGKIKQYCTGTSDMSFYGDEQEDYELISGCIVVPLDSETRKVMKRPQDYVVDQETKEIFIKAEAVNKFKVKKKKV